MSPPWCIDQHFCNGSIAPRITPRFSHIIERTLAQKYKIQPLVNTATDYVVCIYTSLRLRLRDNNGESVNFRPQRRNALTLDQRKPSLPLTIC